MCRIWKKRSIQELTVFKIQIITFQIEFAFFQTFGFSATKLETYKINFNDQNFFFKLNTSRYVGRKKAKTR